MPVNFKFHINYDLEIEYTVSLIRNFTFPWSLDKSIWDQHGIIKLDHEN